MEQGGPTNPATQVPASLWRPPAGAMPTDASAAYIEGESGEPVSGGRSYAWSNRVADFFGSAQPTGVAFSLYGDEYLDIDLTLPHGANRFRAGSYRDLVGDPPNPLRGLLRVSILGNECDKPFGWVAIDSISYVGDAPVSVDLRFEQRCRSASAPALPRLVPVEQGRPHPAGPEPPTGAPGPVAPRGGNDAQEGIVPAASQRRRRSVRRWPHRDDRRSTRGAPGRADVGPRVQRPDVHLGHHLHTAAQRAASGRALRRHRPEPVSQPPGRRHRRRPLRRHVQRPRRLVRRRPDQLARDSLADLSIRFSVSCDGDHPALHGVLEWQPAAASGAPPAPQDLQTGRVDRLPSLTWDAVAPPSSSAVSAYRIIPYVDGEATPSAVVPADQRSFVARELPNGSSVTFRVQAINAAGASLLSLQTRPQTLGPTDDRARLITAVYRDLFQRRPDAAGLAYWSARLAAGVSRLTLVRTLAISSEARTSAVKAAFLTYIDQLPSTSQLRSWSDRLARTPTTDLETALLAGETSWRRLLVDRTYRTVLNRPADPTARAFWTAQLLGGRTVASLRINLMTSEEYLRRAVA